jgi:hypothetical protein
VEFEDEDVDEDDEEPDEPESSEEDDPESPLFVVVVVVVVVEPVAPETPVVLLPVDVAVEDPGCSRATTTPRTTVAPVAARTAPRVSCRRRDCARLRPSGVFGCGSGISGLGLCSRGRLHPTIPESTPSHGPLWVCCDILPVADLPRAAVGHHHDRPPHKG